MHWKQNDLQGKGRLQSRKSVTVLSGQGNQCQKQKVFVRVNWGKTDTVMISDKDTEYYLQVTGPTLIQSF